MISKYDLTKIIRVDVVNSQVLSKYKFVEGKPKTFWKDAIHEGWYRYGKHNGFNQQRRVAGGDVHVVINNQLVKRAHLIIHFSSGYIETKYVSSMKAAERLVKFIEGQIGRELYNFE